MHFDSELFRYGVVPKDKICTQKQIDHIIERWGTKWLRLRSRGGSRKSLEESKMAEQLFLAFMCDGSEGI